MSILEKIVRHKQGEVARKKETYPISHWEKRPGYALPRHSTQKSLTESPYPGILAEFKTQSPSKGVIHPKPDAVQELHPFISNITHGYQQAGAKAISVLTDEAFFGGGNKDLEIARQAVDIPLLRKDFIIDEYQLHEARALGADLVLLIAACLPPEELKELARVARSLDLEVLLEVHNREELEQAYNENIDIVGVNNRNLKTFEVSLDVSLELAELIPSESVKISESGLKDVRAIESLWNAGYKGFLIGETFMKTSNPGQACQQMMDEILSLSQFSNSIRA